MSDPNSEAPPPRPQDRPFDLGVYARPERGLATSDFIAIALTAIWLIGVIIYFLFLRPTGQTGTPGGFIMSFLAILLPIALIWIGATVAKTARVMREEATRLQAAIDGMRQAYVTQSQSSAMGVKPAVERKLDEIAASQKQTESALATFTTARDAGPARAASPQAMVKPAQSTGDSQTSLALGTPSEDMTPPISIDDFIGALNFPETENDAEGFRQLRIALKDRDSAKLVRASQDVLTLLSQDGIYMDDLRPDRARPEVWRQFAAGERGRAIAGLGGVHDRSSLALASGRMRSDAIFRDSVHHFLREFDRVFAGFAEVASDGDIIKLAETRTARAFMLMGRATGTFD
jgi:hypothetical protein